MPRAISRSPMMTRSAPSALQMLDLGVRMRARDDLDARVGGARLLHDLSGLEGVRNRDEQIPGAGEIGGLQHVGTRGIADDRLDLALAKLRDDLVGILDDEERLVCSASGPRRRGCRRGHSRPGSYGRSGAWLQAMRDDVAGAAPVRRLATGASIAVADRAAVRGVGTAESTAAKISGLSTIDRIAPARMRSRPLSAAGSAPRRARPG